MTEKIETQETQKTVNISGDLTTLTVEELYDKEKFDLSTMEPGDVFQLLQYVYPQSIDIPLYSPLFPLSFSIFSPIF